MKKAQGISITTIIIAAIALIVLVVLVLIFSGRMGIFTGEIEKQDTGTTCPDANIKNAAEACDPGYKMGIGKYTRSDGTSLKVGEKCCVDENTGKP